MSLTKYKSIVKDIESCQWFNPISKTSFSENVTQKWHYLRHTYPMLLNNKYAM